MLGLAYDTCPSGVDEKAIRDKDPVVLTRKLAEAKASRVANAYPDAVIVSGDAVASKDGRIYEKPGSEEEAAQFLRELSGSAFQFVTALAVMQSRTGKLLSAVESSTLSFRELTEREIRAYIRSHSVMSYAGAFENDAVLQFAESISGSYNFVTALPVSRLVLFLREQGVDV